MSTDMSIDEKLDAILAIVRNLEKRTATQIVKQAVASTVEPAPDSDLDGEYGNPVVERKDPPRWKGDSFIGSRFSECPADYLDLMAGFLAWKAGKNDEDEKKALASGDDEAAKKANKRAFYARKEAARAAGWARRIRDGYTPPVVETPSDDSIPF